MDHTHEYDKNGVCVICSQTSKVYDIANNQYEINKKNASTNQHFKEVPHEHNHQETHDHTHELHGGVIYLFKPAIISLILLLSALTFDHLLKTSWFVGWIRVVWYILAYLPVGIPVLKDAWKGIKNGNFFSEFFLMGIATLGAFSIQEYPEAVAVMLFYSCGEAFQTLAVYRAKSNIKSLLDQRPDEVNLLIDGKIKLVKAKNVEIGDVIQLRAGDKLALDGKLLSETASFNTAALTGESKPDSKRLGDTVFAGMINLNSITNVEVTANYENSKLSKILELVQQASKQKALTELFISKFAKIYTPIVVLFAVGIIILPFFFLIDYDFKEWLYRALLFLVVSCPCALVISIPLGYFGGIGAASRHGILIKGGNFLDLLASAKHIVMDKTGTMTHGVFKVNEVNLNTSIDKEYLLEHINEIESKSTHPVANAIHEYVGDVSGNINLDLVEEIAGHGLKANVEGKEFLVGNFKLMDKFNILYPEEHAKIVFTTIAIAVDGEYIGYISITDKIKNNANETIEYLHEQGLKVTMLSGDKSSVVDVIAKELHIDSAYGGLLPEDKVKELKRIKEKDGTVVFVGDGINDAPVVAISDVGIAMGGLGSDATIETADVVIQDDQPIKIPMAIMIGKKTKMIVWQNIVFAFSVKVIVLILGAGGLATMWEAVFADVGVALLAILNAVRIQNTDFTNFFKKSD